MTTDPSTLDTLRREIDQIDDAMHDLLMRRAAMVAQIAAAKGPGSPAIRPAREAAILRRLAGRHRGGLPPAVVLRIWREIIGAITRMQAPLNIAVADGGGAAPRRDLARDYFGCTAPLTLTGSAQSAIARVLDGSATVAILPWPEEDDPEPWWRHLGIADSHPAGPPLVVAHLPFGAGPAEARALVVGRLAFEDSGDDHSLAVLEIEGDLSRSRMRRILEAAGLGLVDVWEAAAPSAGAGLRLIELPGHLAGGDPRLAALAAAEPALRLRPIGGFAVPIPLDSSKRTES